MEIKTGFPTTPTSLTLGLIGIVLFILAIAIRRWDMSRLASAQIIPAPPHSTLGQEPPAIVAMLAHRFSPAGFDAAISATFMDLAARGIFELIDYGDDLTATFVRIKNPALSASLNSYERMIFDRVEEELQTASNNALPLIDLRWEAESSTVNDWLKKFDRSLRRHSRSLGLSRSLATAGASWTFRVSIALLLMGVILGFCSGLGCLVMGGLFVIVCLIAWLQNTDTYTPYGAAVTAAWMGLRDYLLTHPSFTQLPPASVTIWDRYLPYAVALDAAPHLSDVLKKTKLIHDGF